VLINSEVILNPMACNTKKALFSCYYVGNWY
jgi:hypothetical protein